MAFVDLSGLNYFYTKIKGIFALASHTHSVATTSANGYMSKSDKSKLNGIATGATKNSITQTTVTLTSSGWGSNEQTVTVSGVTASNMVVVSVLDDSCGINCTAQASNTLTFVCDTTPSSDITVNVAILI